MNQLDQILGESMISYSINRPLILPVPSISLIDHTVLSVNSSNNTIMNIATSVQSVFDNMINQREYITNLGTILDSLGLLITKS